MAFEMSLPHAPRIKEVQPDGRESLAQDEQQWDLYYAVQAALEQRQESVASGSKTARDAAGSEEGAGAAKPSPPAADPQKVLDKLLTARGELDVIIDLITFVEQQQFLAVAGIHRHPPSLEERVRARSLRLAGSKQQLRCAAERLAGGAAALRAQRAVQDAFFADLAALRRRWRLARHAGEGALFYADISLPLRGAAAQGISQEGAQCNLIMDTNGDACIVEAAAAGGGARRAVRGASRIQSVLEAKQRLLTWQVLRQLAQTQAQQPRFEADPDGAVAALLRMLGTAAAAAQEAVYAAVASGGGGGEDAVAAAATDSGGPMDIDGHALGSGQQAAAVGAGQREAGQLPSSSGSDVSDPMLSSAAQDILASLPLPGFQQQFEARALRLLARLLPGGGASSSAATCAGDTQQSGLLDSLLRWLRHAALCQRVSTRLREWSGGAAARGVRRVHSGEEFTQVWQLLGCRAAGAAPTLVVAAEDCLWVEGVGAAAGAVPAGTQRARGLTRQEFDRALQVL